MAIIGKGTKSYRKLETPNQKANVIGYKKTVFAHKAVAGATSIDIGALTLPTLEMPAFVNPSFGEIVTADMKRFRSNVRVTSSLRGVLLDHMSFDIPTKERIDLIGFAAEEGEIFVVEIDGNARTGMQIVDATPLVATGTLLAGQTEFSVGASFEINKYPTRQVGAVLVYVDGQLQFRNAANATAAPGADGNYQEVDSGSGFGTLIKFNSALVDDAAIVVVSNGAIAERPSESQQAEIEALQGQVDRLVQTVAALAGVPTTNFQTAPSQVQLAQFGDRMLDLETKNAPGQRLGANTNDDAAAGKVGEYLSNTASEVTLTTTATLQEMTSITLTPGDWDVSGAGTFRLGAGSVVSGSASLVLSKFPTTSTADFLYGFNANDTLPPTATSYAGISIPPLRIKVASGTTQIMYLKCSMQWSSGGAPVLRAGYISARRVR